MAAANGGARTLPGKGLAVPLTASAAASAAASVFLFLGFAALSPAASQSLEDELASLVESHPQIRAAYKAIASSSVEIGKAAAGFLPTINLTGDIGPELIDSPTQRAVPGGKPWLRSKQITTLTVTQTLFQGFAVASATKSARLNKLVSESNFTTTIQNTLFEGITAYIDVLRQMQLAELALLNEETIQIQLNLEDERVQKGSGIAVDVLQAKSRLQLAKERRITFEGALEDAFSRYTQVFDHPPDIDELIEPMPAAELIPDSLDATIDIGLAENPAIINSDRQLELAREKRRLVRAELYPKLDLVSRANYEKNNSGTLGIRRDFSVLLQANWDLFTGLTSRANAAQAAFDYSASRDNNAFVVRKVIEQVKLAWQGLQTARNRLGLLENAVNIASEVFDSRKKLREAGKETVINVLDAEGEVFNSRINFASALFDEKVSVFQLLLAMGRLDLPELQGAGLDDPDAPDGEDLPG